MKLLPIFFVIFLSQNTNLFAQVKLVEKPLLSVPLQNNENNLKLLTLDFSDNQSLDLIYNVSTETETLFYLEENRGNNEFYPPQLLFKIPVLDTSDSLNSVPNKLISQFAVLDYDSDGDFDFLVLFENDEKSFMKVFLNEHNDFSKSQTVFEFNRKKFNVSDLKDISFDNLNKFIVLKDVSNDLLVIFKIKSEDLSLNVIGELKNFKSPTLHFMDFDYDYDYDIILNFNSSNQKIRIYSFDKGQFTLKEVGIESLSKQDYKVHHTSDLFGYANTILAITPKKIVPNSEKLQQGYALDYHHELEKFTAIDTFFLKVPSISNNSIEMDLYGVCLSNTNLCDLVQQIGNEIFFLKNKYIKRIAEGDKSIFEEPVSIQLSETLASSHFSIFRTINLNFGNDEIILENKNDKDIQFFLLTTE